MLQNYETNQGLSILNEHPKLMDGPRLLHELVSKKSSSNAPAIDFLEHGSKRRTITYDELHASSEYLAWRLAGALEKLKDASAIVPVFLPQGPELYIALLAILKSGRAFCPIGLDTPRERLDFILQDISASVIITDAGWKEYLRFSQNLQILLVDETIPKHTGSVSANELTTGPAHLAYVLYTSGSTGLPKAVSVSHRAVTQSLLAHDRHIPRFSRFLQFAAPTFDVSIFEIFFPLYRGCTVVGCTRAQMLNDLPGIITSLDVDAAELTPTVVNNLLQGRKSVPTLRLLLTIGEMLTRNVIDEFGGHGDVQSVLWAMYGPTEAAIHCTLQPCLAKNAPVATIGYPLDTVTVFVVTPASTSKACSDIQVLPFGEIGELVIGGAQIADEYLNRQELSAASFIQHPEYGILYRTGDKGRLGPDNVLECLGRIVSGQVKLRGQRVELGEIEQVILDVDACHSTVVMVIDEVLVAFCAGDRSKLSSAGIDSRCRRWLPNYMVPAEIIILETMPQLASGKVDKVSLQTQYQHGHGSNGPQSAQSHTCDGCPITQTIQNVLGREISKDADLVSVGMDSLRSIRIATSLRAHGYLIGPMDILAAPNLDALIATCTTKKEETSAPEEILSIKHDFWKIPELEDVLGEVEEVVPCTPLQEAMLTETQFRPAAYCNWMEIELHKRQSFQQIREHLLQLSQQNEILRSGFLTSSTANSFLQVVWRRFPDSSIKAVHQFSRKYSLGSEKALLRPFSVQVLVHDDKPRLLFQIHHALYDGWSLDLIIQDLGRLIARETVKSRPQFREVVKYHLSLQQSETLGKSKTYWASVLCEYHPKSFPNYYGKLIHNQGLVSFHGESAVSPLLLLSRANEAAVNPQVFFQLAVAYMLSLYHGSSDVVLGTVTSGRTIPITDVENIVGPCIASVPFRVDFSKTSRIGQLIQQTQRTNRDMLQHCNMPLRDILRLCNLRPGERLFDALFIWQQSHLSSEDNRAELTMVDSADDLEFRLTLEFEPRLESIQYRITYDHSIFPESQIKHLVRQIDEVTTYLLLNIEGEAANIPGCFSSDSIAVANPQPGIETIRSGPAHAVERRALMTPHKDALIVGKLVNGVMCIKDTLSYASLNARANQLARVLLAHGVSRDQLVCIVLEKSINLYVSILAILKVGCGYLPITPETPLDRTKTMLADAEVALCISDSSTASLLQSDSLTVIAMDRIDFSSQPGHDLNIPYEGSRLAYAVFTSGSTGKPKGVLVTQENLMSNLVYLASLYPTKESSRLLQSCSQAFDVSVFEIFFSWYVGICLCTAPMSEMYYDFESTINRLSITHLSLTPTVAGLVDPVKVPKVEFLVTAGEALTEKVRRMWAGKGLFQGYGPSETTNICTVRPNVTNEDLINNIGKPFPNTSLVIMAPGQDQIVPRGALGELCFGGAQVFRGYLKRPELNAQKLLRHHLYGRIYRSGDMGILLPDDSILSIGRLDDQVKIRGQRVELGEITSLVLDHIMVQDCTTLLQKNGNSSHKLVTFWVPVQTSISQYAVLSPMEHRKCILDLFEMLSLRLPTYMVPSHIVPISQIPMTRQAKVDHRRLRDTLSDLSQAWLDHTTWEVGVETHTWTYTGAEQILVEALTRVLDVKAEQVAPNTSFFSLGLDSVSAIRFAKELRNSGCHDVLVADILKNPTIHRLSSILAELPVRSIPSAEGRNQALANIFGTAQVAHLQSECRKFGSEARKVFPCTPLQEAMLSNPSTSAHAYQNTMIFSVNGQLDLLKHCWTVVLRRHEIFRTTFIPTEHSQYAYAQVVLVDETVHWDCLGPTDDIGFWAGGILPKLLQARRPPIRLAIQNTPTSTKLIFACHHALYDGIAISNLLGEIQELYSGGELPSPIAYEQFLQLIVTQEASAADEFWSLFLTGYQPKSLPSLTGKAPLSGGNTFTMTRDLHIPLDQALEFCRANSISLLAVMQAVWTKLLLFLTGEEDICFGNVVSGRALLDDDLERLVAPCFNTLPVRMLLKPENSNIDICQRLHSYNIESLPFHLTPLRRIQSRVLGEHGRLFDTLVILQQPGTLLDESIWSLEADRGAMDLPLVCEVFQSERGNQLKLTLHYSDAVLERPDATLVTKILDRALQSVIQSPRSAMNDTCGFPERLLANSNSQFSNLSSEEDELLHSAFELNAAQRPDSIALDFLERQGSREKLTFKELDEKANQIAHALIKHAVGPEDVVPVHLAKSPYFYASILGVLKAGAAFAPVHPDLPETRKLLILTELCPKVILCHTSPLEWAENTTILDVTQLEDNKMDKPQAIRSRPSHLAYCIYTSGSTGTPKAVAVEHRAPLSTIASSRAAIPWHHDSRLLQYASTTFDMCYYDCFLAWSFGFTLCAAEQDVMLNDLVHTIRTLGVDLLDLTPSVASFLRRSEVPNVKWLYCIGEAMSVEIVREWEGACVNSYGPTEAAFCTTIFPVSRSIKPSVIGTPFPKTSFAVFPPNGERPLPILGAGELYIGGAQLARGYYGKTDLTEEKFVTKCGQSFYKSGDIVRMLSDGTFEFLGRADDQVKIRGLRVELGEINFTINHSDHRIAATTTQILRKPEDEKGQLVSFLVPHGLLHAQEKAELREKAQNAVKGQLPAYMVPQFFFFIDHIPKSMAGKVDRKALLEVFIQSDDVESGTHLGAQNESDHEWTSMEEKIRKVFSKLSKVPLDGVLPSTTIYQLGLDSISAVQIAAALRRDGHSVNAADVMRQPCCKNLAAWIANASSEVTSKVSHFDFKSFEQEHREKILQTYGIPNASIEAIRPCTSLQCGMISQFLANDKGLYFNYLRLSLNDGVDAVRLRDAWETAMQKNVMLRTGFVHVNDKRTPFVMIQYTYESISMPWIGMTTSAEPTDKWIDKAKHKAADQIHQPPWCARVVRIDDATHLDLTLLHAIFDAHSLQRILRDVAMAYHDEDIGMAVPLDPLLGSLIHLSSVQNTESSDFWTRLGRSAAPTQFPNLSPLRHQPSPSATITRFASRTLVELDTGCRKANISLQVAGLASWGSLLTALTGENSVMFGVVLSGRNIQVDGVESLAFPCISTVPFVYNSSNVRADVLKDVMGLNTAMQSHGYTPLNEIQKMMGYPRTQLFDTIFAFQKIADQDSDCNLWTIKDEKATLEYPISIELKPKEEYLEYRLTFLPHLLPQEHATLILDQLDHLLQYYVFADAPQSMDTARLQTLYSVTPAREPTIPAESRLLHEMVELAAAKYPGRIALEFATSLRDGIFKSCKWTYAELDREGNKVAQLLKSQGVIPGELVGLCFDKCPEASFSMLGILKAGCAFVALDPGAPSARKAFMINDSGIKVILSLSTQSTDFENEKGVVILNLDEVDWSSISPEKLTLARKINTQDRSYCLYTSGTTGTPKCCELTHENAVQALLSFQRLFAGHWNEQSRWLQFASFHFDVSVLEQFWSWFVGICVVSAPRDLILEDLATSIRTLGITHIDLTPSLARILHPDDVPNLCKGVFITGGESLKQEILDVWGPKGVIYNGYGPTEATIGVTMYPRVPTNGKPSNIGRQFDNVGSYVLFPGSEDPVLRGGIGELCVAGKLVGKGYLNRPELTEQRFPHLKRFNDRVYRTGDLVRILHDGTFDFLGRADDQVKLRGQRLEIGEINAVIKQSGHIVVDVATVVLTHSKQQKQQLISFVVTGSGANKQAQIAFDKIGELMNARIACKERLPPYMVPTHFVPLTAMPLSPNNKADVRRLREMYEGLTLKDLQLLSSASESENGAFSVQEERLCSLLKDALETEDNFGRDTDFFELGMDSISVIGVSQALKQGGFPKATVSIIMKNATVRRLAKALSTDLTSNARGSIVAARQAIAATQHRHRRAVAETLFTDARNIESLAPCTPLQQGMIARSLENERGLYFNTFYFKLADDINPQRLEDAWQSVLDSTQILKTKFVNTDDGYVQAALHRAHLRFENVVLPAGTQSETYLEDRKREWIKRNRPNLKSPFELVHLEQEGKSVLVVYIFHALYDGNSVGLLFRCVKDAYAGGTPYTGLPFQSALAYGPLRSMNGSKDFWENHLRDQSPKPISIPAGGHHDQLITVSRSMHNLESFETMRRKLNVTAQAIVQACWMAVLHNYVGSSVTIGMVVSGRSIELEGAEQLIGPLFNTIPFQHRAEKGQNWGTIIRNAHAFNVAAYPYQHTPLRDIMKWLKRGPGQSLFDSLFVYQVADDDKRWTRNEIWELMDAKAEADYPLALEIEQHENDSLKITLIAQGNAHDTKTADELVDQLESALSKALNDPDATFPTSASTGERMDREFQDFNEPTRSATTGSDTFKWSKAASILREEIAQLAGIAASDINESTSIFELGLDSIDAIKLSSKAKKRGIDLPVSGIMRGITIANMVSDVSSTKKRWDDRPSDMIFQSHKKRLEHYLRRRGLSKGVEKILPLTPLQEGMVAEMIASEYTRYYNHDVLKLELNTDVERLRDAWTEVVKRSPILRTSFIHVEDTGIDSSFAQLIHEKLHTFWKSTQSDNEPNFAHIFESSRQEAIKSSWSDPLFHVQLVRAPQQNYLVLSIAHALYDGWSLELLHSDVARAYNGHLISRPSYEQALHETLTTSGADAIAFWRDHLSDAKLNSFKRRKPAKSLAADTVHRRELASSVPVSGLISFAKKNNITLQTLGLTAYSLTLASYVHSLDVTFGSVLSGRNDEQRTQLLFPTMNTVAIRTILHGTRLEMLHYVQDTFANIQKWQHFPLRKAIALAEIQGTLFQSLFIHQKRAQADNGKQTKLYESTEGHSNVEYPVCVEMEVVEDQLVWRCAVKEEVLDDTGAGELLDTLSQVLASLLEQPDAQTIEFMDQGTSICALAPFGAEADHNRGEELDTSDTKANNRPNAVTVKVIREVLSFVSKVPEQDITENSTIFHIGLDSISAIKVSSLLRKRGIDLSVGEMLKAGTADKMAQVVHGRETITQSEDGNSNTNLDNLAGIDLAQVLTRSSLQETDVEQILPATAGQQYMLVMWIRSGGAVFYPEFVYELRGSMNFETLRAAWDRLVRTSAILRTRFIKTDNDRMPYLQAVMRQVEVRITDMTDWPEGEITKAKTQLKVVQPFVHLFVSRSQDVWTLRVKIHHALYDGVSLPILMRQLQHALAGVPLQSTTTSLRGFVAATSSSTARGRCKTYWTEYLKGVTQNMLTQPSSAPSKKVEIFCPGLVGHIGSLESFARQNGITMQSLVLAVYAKVYAAITSTQSDVVIGVYLANRSLAIRDIANAAIPTLNLVPLRVCEPLEMGTIDVAAQIQYDIQKISSPENASVSLWEISQWTGVTIDTFVNVLKLPDAVEESVSMDRDMRMVQLGQWDEAMKKVIEVEMESLEVFRELGNESINAAYLHAIDIEVRIGDGMLDMGIFAPEGMLRLVDGEKLVEEVKLGLEAAEKEQGF